MLLTEKIEEISFSPAEREVVRYILTDYTRIENTTVKEIAEKNLRTSLNFDSGC
ncbi:hypothetical protein TMUPMC115_1701 [Tetragenococcus muriaticus PMC-11-5]|uniref:Uncharacterized protein n=1 Tax=Tetragenococcus muriaticus PMC-11-5 TaxID=1302649 RepID=A0A091C474_9ENTE|nr:hypothetical protein TMUPMC115_1701 [Tetragenococcus muriaticus PMC-11-5]